MTSKKYKELSVREFTKAAEIYESDSAGVYKMCKKDYPDVLAELEKEPFNDLLDCGCGTGPMLTLLHQKYPDKHYTGIDLTPKMIEVAKRKKMKGVELVVGDCENLPFAEYSFDAVICCESFHHYPDPQRFFDSVYRVLRPNGRLILRDMTMNSAAARWFCNTVEMPLAHLIGKGGMSASTAKRISVSCARMPDCIWSPLKSVASAVCIVLRERYKARWFNMTASQIPISSHGTFMMMF